MKNRKIYVAGCILLGCLAIAYVLLCHVETVQLHSIHLLETILRRSLDHEVWLARFQGPFFRNIFLGAFLVVFLGLLYKRQGTDNGSGAVGKRWQCFFDAEKLRKGKLSAISTVVMMMVTHLYVWINGPLIMDAAYVYRGGFVYKIISDKWVDPLLWFLDRGMNLPWLGGLLATGFMIVSVYLLVDLLKLQSALSIWLVAALCSTNMTIVSQQEYTGLVYIGECALCFALLAAKAMVDTRMPLWLRVASSVLLVAFCAGTYAAYVPMTACVLALLMVCRIFRGKETARELWLQSLRWVLSFGGGLVLYYVVERVSVATTGGMMQTYMDEDKIQSLSSVGEMLPLIPEAYKYVLQYYLGEHCYLPAFLYELQFVMLLLGTVVAFFAVKKRWESIRRDKGKIALFGLILVMLPLLINMIFVLSFGVVHFMMIFAYITPALACTKAMEVGAEDGLFQKRLGMVFACVTALFVYGSIVTANGAYVSLVNMEKVAGSVGTRILDRVEMIPGYTGDETLIFVGKLADNAYFRRQTNDSDIMNAFIGQASLATSNGLQNATMMRRYFENVLGVNANCVFFDEMDAFAEEVRMYSMADGPRFLSEEELMHSGLIVIDFHEKEVEVPVLSVEDYEAVLAMPAFPADRSVMKRGNVVYIKLSEDLEKDLEQND